MTWMVNWRVWHLPWHYKYPYEDYPKVWIHYAGVGPFQWHWYSA